MIVKIFFVVVVFVAGWALGRWDLVSDSSSAQTPRWFPRGGLLLITSAALVAGGSLLLATSPDSA
jgi:hypothetical protein